MNQEPPFWAFDSLSYVVNQMRKSQPEGKLL
jgi:hypothetical protein